MPLIAAREISAFLSQMLLAFANARMIGFKVDSGRCTKVPAVHYEFWLWG